MSESLKRYLMIVGLALIGIAAALGLILAIHVTKGYTLEQSLLGLVGATETHEYASTNAVPAGARPSWLPAAASGIRTDGWPLARDAQLKLSATVPAGTALPAACEPTPYSKPWDAGKGWPDLSTAAVSDCDGWRAVLDGTTLYAWH
ncbi:hypothetical protein QT381_02000 [Galbitalea sp. SE-J8]|uniref:hypothetical protein n=1 Tax=Galbitalea sp. SE-J8 TaxID=3054952 RepID=UPI00259CD2D4|nr:hypothetical protein [Galbitalea sp. SE-J8]MDM4761776.1 hypothetical protein [Galbitalea sp. SE-J8]